MCAQIDNGARMSADIYTHDFGFQIRDKMGKDDKYIYQPVSFCGLSNFEHRSPLNLHKCHNWFPQAEIWKSVDLRNLYPSKFSDPLMGLASKTAFKFTSKCL